MDFDKLIVSVTVTFEILYGLTHLFKQLASQEVRITNTAKPASARVLQMLNLRSIVKNLPLLQKALSGSKSQLLQIIHSVRLLTLFFHFAKIYGTR